MNYVIIVREKVQRILKEQGLEYPMGSTIDIHDENAVFSKEKSIEVRKPNGAVETVPIAENEKTRRLFESLKFIHNEGGCDNWPDQFNFFGLNYGRREPLSCYGEYNDDKTLTKSLLAAMEADLTLAEQIELVSRRLFGECERMVTATICK